MLRGRIERPRIGSELLAGNPLGDPSERELVVYLPPSYEVDRERRYPLLMVLAPYAANHLSLLNYKLWEPGLFDRYEAQIERGEAREAIVVAPDCLNRWGGSQFVDSAASGPYQRHLVEEVLPFVDARYRTLPRASGRAVVGRSSGGFGALRLGLDRPGFFSAYGSHAGDCAFELSVRPGFVSAAIAYDRAGGLLPFIERFEAQGPRGSEDFYGIMTLANAAAYAPCPEDPFPHCALPFEIESAELSPAIWERWLAHDPLRLLEEREEAFKEARLVFLDAGDRDEHGLHFGARRLARRLEARGVPVTHEEFPGGHRGTAYRYERSLPLLLSALEEG